MTLSESRIPPVITFDGPAGTGKGTISRLVAKKLGWHHLESGSLFRALAYAALTQHFSLEDEMALSTLANTLDIGFQGDQVFLSNTNITDVIHTEAIGKAASKIAILPEVRAVLTNKQKTFRQLPGLVADGRDMGTAVFTDAILKFFLDATPEERAKRRHTQLKKMGLSVSLGEILEDLKQRDARDRTRSVSPLVPASDAIIIDTTTLRVEGVFEEILGHLSSKTTFALSP